MAEVTAVKKIITTGLKLFYKTVIIDTSTYMHNAQTDDTSKKVECNNKYKTHKKY